uniref:TonB-dependent receptor plug domain-containing protein n=1 Tax=uncultured Sphingomonas sp. TaxID=158754 RepID=UPI0025E75930|nr:TonB-dependent receptor [uncultured Sphingomonas sp.]
MAVGTIWLPAQARAAGQEQPGQQQGPAEDSPVEPTPTPTDETNEPSATNLAVENEAEAGAEIVVTGSRIRRPDFTTPNPVISVGSDQIEASGTSNLTDFLTGYPALQGSSTSADNSGSGAGIGFTGLNLLNLRNLGTDRTLVLVDGRRHIAGVPGSQAVDINTIPSDLVERVDVLTGGASAIYGADGVTGVVNFVLKRNFEGITARAQAGIGQRGDSGQRLFAITAGENLLDDRLNVAVAFEHGEEDRLTTRDRNRLSGENAVGFFLNPDDPENFPGYDGPVDNGIPDNVPLRNIRYFDTNREGGIDIDFDGFPDYFVGAGGQLVAYDPGEFVPDFFQQGGNATLVSDYGNDLLPKIRRNVLNLVTNYELTPSITLFAEGKFARSKSFTLGQPTFDYYLYIPGDNAFYPEDLAAITGGGDVLINRDNFDLGQRGENIRRTTWRGVLGARGDITENANFELSYVYGRTNVQNRYVGDILTDRFYAAIDAVIDPATGQPTCRVNIDPSFTPFQPFNYTRDEIPPTTFQPGECAPLNLFGEGVASQAALDFVRVNTTDRARLNQHVVSGSIAGDFGRFFTFPGGGELGYALGAEYRREASRFNPDDLAAQGLTFGNALGADRGKFNVKEGFAELRAPLLRELPFAHSLEFGAAVRLSDYSTIGRTNAWKVDAAYAPVRDITFAGTYSTAVRAPNIGELFGASSQTFAFITDPCNLNQLQNGSEFRAENCAALLTALGADPATYRDPRSVNIPGISSGNRNLSEEEAKTWTAGVILQPSFLRGFSARLDWYNIKLEDAINQVEPEEVAELCVDQATLDNPFCDLIVRQSGATGDADAGNIVDFSISPQNVARFSTAGLDLNLSYRLRTERAGTFSLNVIGNYLDKLEFIGTPGAPVTDERATAFAPKYSANVDLTWQLNALTLNYGLQYFSKTSRFSNQELENNPDIAADEYKYYRPLWKHDVFASLDVGRQFEFYGGVNNLLDRKPDIGANSYPISSVGRYFFAGARVKLGGAAR